MQTITRADDYQAFLTSKRLTADAAGFSVKRSDLSPILFNFQKDVVTWALQHGKAALFLDTGLGKSFCQLEWARHVTNHTGGKVLILAPLAVGEQTVREAAKLGMTISYERSQETVKYSIAVTNYEMLERFDADEFIGIVLDESSRIKSYDSKTRDAIIGTFARTPYKLACTATPAPNDHMELGNHAEFLGAMTRVEMLAICLSRRRRV